MALSVRPIATTGVALAAAGIVAVVPSAPPALIAATPVDPEQRAVALTSSENPLVAWVDLFNTTQVNNASLINHWLDAPFPVLQQMFVNGVGYFGELPNFGEILDQKIANFNAAKEALVAANTQTLDAQHVLLYTGLQAALAADPDLAFLEPVVEYLTTYSSGQMLGVLGTFLSPWLAFSDSIHDIIDYTFGEDPDLGKALNTFLNIPADWLNGFFNGYGEIDLSFLSPTIAEILSNQLGVTVNIPAFAIVMGGLLSGAGTPSAGTTAAVAGGSALQGITLHATTPGPFGSTIPLITANGTPVGPLAAWVNQGKVQAKAIGWSGVGNPIAELLPTEEGEEEVAEEGADEEEAVEEGAGEEEAVEEAGEEGAEEGAGEEEAVEEEGAGEDGTGEEDLIEEDPIGDDPIDEELIELALAEDAETEEEPAAEDSADSSTDAEDPDTDTETGDDDTGDDSGDGDSDA